MLWLRSESGECRPQEVRSNVETSCFYTGLSLVDAESLGELIFLRSVEKSAKFQKYTISMVVKV